MSKLQITPKAGALLLRGGIVIDGTGGPRALADVRVHDGRIGEIGVNLAARGETEIDVAGRIVAPGFIDVHTHDDQMVLASPEMLPKVSQGVTTVVVGNCGISLAPLQRSILFDAGKGTVTPTATFAITDRDGRSIRQIVNIMGRVRSCTTTRGLGGLRPC